MLLFVVEGINMYKQMLRHNCLPSFDLTGGVSRSEGRANLIFGCLCESHALPT